MQKPAARWHLLGFGDKKPKAFGRTNRNIENGSPELSCTYRDDNANVYLTN